MGIEKAELKALVANDIGADIEDQLEAAVRVEHQFEGGRMALGKAEQNLAVIIAALEKALEDGELDHKELDSQQAVYGLLKRWLGRCAHMLAETREHEHRGQIGAAGMIKGIRKCMAIPLKMMQVERAKIEAVKIALDGGEARILPDGSVEATPSSRPGARAPGARPGDPLAGVRARGAKPNGKAKRATKKRPAKKTAKKRATKRVAKKS
jgi:hypothetical protein